MEITKSSRSFLERAGLRETRRMPTPRVAPMMLPIYTVAVARPHADFVFQGDAAPDSAITVEPWPYGDGDNV